MAKIWRLFFFLPVVLLAGLLAGGKGLAVSRPDMSLTTRPEPSPLLPSPLPPAALTSQPNPNIPPTYQLAGQNDDFQLYANPDTLAFKVVDKRSGYIWHSNLDQVSDDDQLNRTWTAFAQSGLSIDYLDSKAGDERASITNSEVRIAFQLIQDGFAANVTFVEPAISLGLIVRLDPAGVVVELPAAQLKEENPDFKLGWLHLYPFLGATKADSVPGYIFIPDGSGALIPLAAETKADNMFYGRYYGSDLGMIASLPYGPLVNRPYKIGLPVMGMVHGPNQQAFLAIVEKGAAYGEMRAHPAGIITQFNFIYNAFIYNESYFQATNRAGAGVTVLQPQTNAFDIAVHYRFLTGPHSNYVGLARSYQAYLLDKGLLPQVAAPETDIGLRLEFLGGEKEKVLFWHRPIPMTTVSQLSDILADLALPNPEVVYYGWQPLGPATMPPRTLRLEGALGNLQQLEGVIAEQIVPAGGHFYLYLDPQAALLDEKGYSTRRDLAMSITNFNLLGHNRNKLNYYFNLETLSDRYASLSQELLRLVPAGWALDGLSSTLYTDFKPNHFLNREAAIISYQQLLAENGGQLAFYRPNAYLFPFMQAYYDMPLGNSGYLYTSEAVPFLQIVLAGYVPYYGPALNFSSNSRDDLLRHADFGVYPSYFLSHGQTSDILNTTSTWIYSSSYQQWGPEVVESYHWLNELLRPVTGQAIIARDKLAEGVFATTYSNGQQIVVNYNDERFTAGDLQVNGHDAIIRQVAP